MHLFLIGGGSSGRRGTINELEAIDRLIVESTELENPNYLFVGLASSFADSYYDLMKNIYKSLGAVPVYLKKKNIVNNPDIVKDKINNADIIYLAGGDTTKLVREAKEYGIDKLLKDKVNSDSIVVGISAGAISLCNDGLSDYKIISKESEDYSFTTGFGFLNISMCPHGNEEKRLIDLEKELNGSSKKVLVIENNACLEINNNICTIHRSDELAKVKLAYFNEGNFVIDELSDSFDLSVINN